MQWSNRAYHMHEPASWQISADTGAETAAQGGSHPPHLEIQTLGERPGRQSPYRAIYIADKCKFLHSQQDTHPEGRIVLWHIT
eukprot:14229702-Heterocapsa_arctica.AAC.1